MKKKRNLFIMFLLIITFICSVIPVCAIEPSIISSYDSGADFGSKQGKGNWYYNEVKNGEILPFFWNGSRWQGDEEYVYCDGSGFHPGNQADSERVFVSPIRGNVHLNGNISLANIGSGDGTKASIYHNKDLLWTSDVNSSNNTNYDLSFSVKKGDELHFRINCKSGNAFDFTIWLPVVAFVTGDLIIGESKFSYFQCDGKQMTALEYNENKEGYVAADGIAFINDKYVSPSQGYALVKRYIVPEEGRYRIFGTLEIEDSRGDGIEMLLRKNEKQIWQQLFIEGEKGTHDIRLYALKGDIIDIVINKNEFAGFDCAYWDSDISRYIAPLPCKATTIAGTLYNVTNSFNLKDIFASEQGANGVSYFSLKNGIEVPMKYDAGSARWISSLNDGGYISRGSMHPGNSTDSVMTLKILKSGMIRIVGDLGVNIQSDGVVMDVYNNSEKIGSNRVGEVRSVRWDEEYDTSYFSNRIDVATEVKQGDILTFSLNRWRQTSYDEVAFSPEIRYISGGILSKTTKWKLKKTVVIDTVNKNVYRKGVTEQVDLFVDNGTTYIAFSDINKITDIAVDNSRVMRFEGKDYLPIREVMEDNTQNVMWMANRLILIYSGIPILYGDSEVSEIALALKEGDLFE